MPRINEPTVAMHRAARERELLDAAHDIFLETGEAPSIPQVAARTGLARTSVYQYFSSRTELLRAMVRDVYPRWTERITSAMEAAPSEADRVMAYAVANVELVAEGAHAIGSALAALAPGEELDEQATRMHREVQEPLVTTLLSLGMDSPSEVAELINTVIHGASRRVETDQDLNSALTLLNTVLGPMIRELGGTGQAHHKTT